MEQKTIKLELSEQEVNLMLNALAELPFKVSAGTIVKIQRQFADGEVKNEKEKVKDETAD